MADDRERDEIDQPGDAKRRREMARFVSGGAPIEKRHQQQPDRREAEGDDPHHFSLDAQNVAGQQLQRVKHREEIPLRPYPCRHRCERVGFASELPGIKGGEGGEDGDGDIPQEHIPEDVIGEERHLPDALSSLYALRHGNRHAHPLALHEQHVHRNDAGNGLHGHREP